MIQHEVLTIIPSIAFNNHNLVGRYLKLEIILITNITNVSNSIIITYLTIIMNYDPKFLNLRLL